MCEDYRATFGVDLDMDTADFAAGRKIACPVLLLWGATGGVGRNHKAAEIWSRYAADIRGAKALPCGHYLSEEAHADVPARPNRPGTRVAVIALLTCIKAAVPAPALLAAGAHGAGALGVCAL